MPSKPKAPERDYHCILSKKAAMLLLQVLDEAEVDTEEEVEILEAIIRDIKDTFPRKKKTR